MEIELFSISEQWIFHGPLNEGIKVDRKKNINGTSKNLDKFNYSPLTFCQGKRGGGKKKLERCFIAEIKDEI